MAKPNLRVEVTAYKGENAVLGFVSNCLKAYSESRVKPNSAVDYLGVTVAHIFNYLKDLEGRLDRVNNVISGAEEFAYKVHAQAMKGRDELWQANYQTEVDKLESKANSILQTKSVAAARTNSAFHAVIRVLRVNHTRMTELEARIAQLEMRS